MCIMPASCLGVVPAGTRMRQAAHAPYYKKNSSDGMAASSVMIEGGVGLKSVSGYGGVNSVTCEEKEITPCCQEVISANH